MPRLHPPMLPAEIAFASPQPDDAENIGQAMVILDDLMRDHLRVIAGRGVHNRPRPGFGAVNEVARVADDGALRTFEITRFHDTLHCNCGAKSGLNPETGAVVTRCEHIMAYVKNEMALEGTAGK